MDLWFTKILPYLFLVLFYSQLSYHQTIQPEEKSQESPDTPEAFEYYRPQTPHKALGALQSTLVKTQQLGKYLSKIRDQVGNLEACKCCHNQIDHHHQLKDFGVYVITSKITGDIVYMAMDWVEWGNTSVGQEYRLEELSCSGSL
ncbi:hypothetical protein DSO57_1034461 [Entomophthora muscae]|uniref:Uncharacterized protein n=1 Tax=Entomophthora muscae TaxID=34485 RepID=A0ACC2TAK3_9FUNG|nr:hypothetical protein DSO57_1034461 [Entomophthora muscae]